MKPSRKGDDVRQCRATSPGSPIDYACGEASRGGIVRKRDAYKRRFLALRRTIATLQQQYTRAEQYERTHMRGLDAHEQTLGRLERERTSLQVALQQQQEKLNALQTATLRTPEAVSVQAQHLTPLQSEVSALRVRIAQYQKAEAELQQRHRVLLTRTQKQNETIDELTTRLQKLEAQQVALLKMLRDVNADYAKIESALA